MKTHLKDFFAYIASEKGLAANTIEAYQRDTKSFASFLHTQGIVEFTRVKSSDIVDYLASLNSAQYASSTICRTLMAIKVLFRFLHREGVVPVNIALYLHSPKLWQLIPDVLTQEEIEALLRQPDENTFLGVRDKAILEVLYASGLRVSELCSLDLFSIGDRHVRVKGKGGKERIVPMGQAAIEAVDAYLLHYRKDHDSETQLALFLSKKGKRIDRVAVWKMIKEYAKRAGIKKNIFPHTLRHSFATHLLDNGADLRIIQEMLGHASIGSTDRYTHVRQPAMRSAFVKFHPRADLAE